MYNITCIQLKKGVDIMKLRKFMLNLALASFSVRDNHYYDYETYKVIEKELKKIG